jgi:hypothetical protein
LTFKKDETKKAPSLSGRYQTKKLEAFEKHEAMIIVARLLVERVDVPKHPSRPTAVIVDPDQGQNK